MTEVRIRVLFFGILRDVVGVREDSLDLAPGGRLDTVFEHYAARFPKLREMSASIVLALNQQFSSPAAPVADGDEDGRDRRHCLIKASRPDIRRCRRDRSKAEPLEDRAAVVGGVDLQVAAAVLGGEPRAKRNE